jgi:UDPglucose 6-dehydrogenase
VTLHVRADFDRPSFEVVSRVRLCVVGLGKLGAPLAAVLARAGHEVTGVDVSERVVELVASGLAPVDEAGLQEVMDAAAGRLAATVDVRAAVRTSEMTFIIVPTPSGADGTFTLEYVLPAIRAIGDELRHSPEKDHIVVVTSTVMPGSTDGPIRAVLESHAGRPVGRRLGLCYSPEFIALGSVVRDMTNPDLLLVGASHRESGQTLAEVLLSFAVGTPPVMHLSLIDAEVAKIAVNTFVTTKISFANMLGEICERLPGADALAVARAVGLDKRIGTRYLRPGTAYGGPCFPRDNVALSALARTLGASADIAEATDRVNRRQAERLARLAQQHLPQGGTIAVLGLTYKPGTHVVEEAAGVAVAAALVRSGAAVTVHDPRGIDGARSTLGSAVTYADDVESAVASADVVVITTPWSEYAGVARLPGPRTIVDCWRCCTEGAHPSVNVITGGRSSALQSHARSAA